MNKELYFTSFDSYKDQYEIKKSKYYSINDYNYYNVNNKLYKPEMVFNNEIDALNSLKRVSKPIVKLY